jgi:hypothetical protein
LMVFLVHALYVRFHNIFFHLINPKGAINPN